MAAAAGMTILVTSAIRQQLGSSVKVIQITRRYYVTNLAAS